MLLGSAALLALSAVPAMAQTENTPVVKYVDENGVNLLTGMFEFDKEFLTIGDGDGKLSYRIKLDLPSLLGNAHLNANNYAGYAWHELDGEGHPIAQVNFDGVSEGFTGAGPTFTEEFPRGTEFSVSGTTYTYKRRDGVIVEFTQAVSGVWSLPTKITFPNGTIIRIHYKAISEVPSYRIQSVTNNHGYQLKLTYLNANSRIVTGVTGINNAVDYCSPTADSCSGLTQSWPTLTIAESNRSTHYWDANTYTITDAAGAATQYRFEPDTPGPYSSRTVLRGVKFAGSSTEDITYTYPTTGPFAGTHYVTGVTRNGRAYTYGGTTGNTLRTDPNGNTLTYVANTAGTPCPGGFEDALGNRTTITCDSMGRYKRITAPEGNYTEYTYDSRGNVTQTKQVAKSGSGLSNIITSATYPSTCTNRLTCNKPTTTTDALGNVTDYTYDSATGNVLTVTGPPPVTSGTRPEVRYGYSALQGYYKNSGGSIVASGENVSLLTSVSSCRTTASCSAGSDEVKTVISYGAQTSGTANNLLPVSTTTGSGDGALTATTSYGYDGVGNVITVDGPLSGSADTVRLRYDAERRVVGVIGPDPDGGGSLTHRAERTTYDGRGRVTASEVGTVASQSDSDWSSLSPVQKIEATYGSDGLKTTDKLIAGSTTYALTQYSYDAGARPDCVTVRMDPSTYSSLPAACTATTPGTYGPDRITKYSYGLSNKILEIEVARGTSAAATQRMTYGNNGKLVTLSDDEGNTTTFEYDGFDRLKKKRYPVTTAGSWTSSTTDFEQFTYNAAGNIASHRLRSGSSIDFTYDNLQRIVTKDLPGSEPDVYYAYDLHGRLLAAVDANSNFNGFAYDALGRATAQSSPLGVSGMGYDLAGRRTLLVYPDNYYVNYDRLVTGQVIAIRENGATSGAGVLASFSYDSLGRRTGVTRGNGTSTTYTYDAVSRLATLAQDIASTASDMTLSFGYNPASQIAGRTQNNDNYAWGGATNLARFYTRNGLNQYTAAGGVSFAYTNGNLTTSGSTTYGYSSENMLTSVTGGAVLGYDPALRLYESTVSSTTTRYLYDGPNLIGEYSSGGTLLRRYVHGTGADEPLVWLEGSGTSDRRWLHADERASIVAVTNGSGAALGRNTYDEYGIPGSGNIGRFQYTGQTWLPELTMYNFKARIYSPTIGRFLQTDPIGYAGGLNLYAYVGNDPVNKNDPMGMDGNDIVVTGTLPPITWNPPAPSTGCQSDGTSATCMPVDMMGAATNEFFEPQESEKGEGGRRGPIGDKPNTICPDVPSSRPVGMANHFWSAVMNPFNAQLARDLGDKAKKAAAEAYPDMVGIDDMRDAFRHFYWVASMAQSRIGLRGALAFANAHEVEGGDSYSRSMDTYNNWTAILMVGDARWANMSVDELAKLAVSNKCLKTLK